MQLINPETGDFCLGPNEVIRAHQSYDAVITFESVEKTWDVKNGYEWIYLAPKNIDDLFFYVSICFFEKKATSLNFGYYTKKERSKMPFSWDDWSEAEELKRKANYDKWLTKNIGKPRVFSWGTVGAYYDMKASTSGIWFSYT